MLKYLLVDSAIFLNLRKKNKRLAKLSNISYNLLESSYKIWVREIRERDFKWLSGQQSYHTIALVLSLSTKVT